MKREVVSIRVAFLSGMAAILLSQVITGILNNYDIKDAKREAFRAGYEQYGVYNAEMKDRYGNIGNFSKGWEDAEIDSILEVRE